MLPAKTSSSSRHTYSRTTHLELAVCCWGTWKRTSKKHKKMKHNVMAVTLGQGCQLEWGMVSCKLYKIFGNDEILFHLGKNEKKARIHEYGSRSCGGRHVEMLRCRKLSDSLESELLQQPSGGPLSVNQMKQSAKFVGISIALRGDAGRGVRLNLNKDVHRLRYVQSGTTPISETLLLPNWI